MTKTYFNAVSTDKLVWKNEEGKEIEVWLKEHRKKRMEVESIEK
jgi:hypothetical protein